MLLSQQAALASGFSALPSSSFLARSGGGKSHRRAKSYWTGISYCLSPFHINCKTNTRRSSRITRSICYVMPASSSISSSLPLLFFSLTSAATPLLRHSLPFERAEHPPSTWYTMSPSSHFFFISINSLSLVPPIATLKRRGRRWVASTSIGLYQVSLDGDVSRSEIAIHFEMQHLNGVVGIDRILDNWKPSE